MPANGALSPSAIDSGRIVTGLPAARACWNAFEPSGSTPTTRASGRRAFTTVAMPAIRPPPPTGTITSPASGTCSSSSRRNRPLAGDRGVRVERVHERAPGVLDQLLEPVERLARAGRRQVDLGAVRPRRLDLLRARALPHHDQGGDPFERCAVGERSGVVAGRDPDHSARLLLRRERGEVGQHAARLERPGALEELGLEVDAGARGLGEQAGGEGRRAVQAARRSPRGRQSTSSSETATGRL